MMKIANIPTDELGDVIAGLVKNGLTFECFPGTKPTTWTINLLGGY